MLGRCLESSRAVFTLRMLLQAWPSSSCGCLPGAPVSLLLQTYRTRSEAGTPCCLHMLLRLTSLFPATPGLPEEVSHTKQALARGYAVIAVDSKDRRWDSRCYS